MEEYDLDQCAFEVVFVRNPYKSFVGDSSIGLYNSTEVMMRPIPLQSLNGVVLAQPRCPASLVNSMIPQVTIEPNECDTFVAYTVFDSQTWQCDYCQSSPVSWLDTPWQIPIVLHSYKEVGYGFAV